MVFFLDSTRPLLIHEGLLRFGKFLFRRTKRITTTLKPQLIHRQRTPQRAGFHSQTLVKTQFHMFVDGYGGLGARISPITFIGLYLK